MQSGFVTPLGHATQRSCTVEGVGAVVIRDEVGSSVGFTASWELTQPAMMKAKPAILQIFMILLSRRQEEQEELRCVNNECHERWFDIY